MLTVQVPKSIKCISNTVAAYVRARYPDVIGLDEVPVAMQATWEKKCNHELFHQDVDRFMGDVYFAKSMEGGL